MVWAFIEWFHNGKPTTLGFATGAVAGLVAITPASGFVDVMGALAIGAGVSVFCFIMVAMVKPKFGYDDSLDAFGVHGIGGIWGALATGLFATKAVNAAGADDAKSVPWERPQAKESFDLETPKVTADVQSAKLKQLLGKIKTS